MELPTAFVAALETAFNRYLKLDPHAAQHMAALDGKVIGIAVEGWDLRLFLLPGSAGIQILGTYEDRPDAVLHAAPLALWRLARGGDAARMMLGQEIRIEGDTQVGQQFKSVLDDLEIDWEEQLARLVGDVLAHQVGRGVRAGIRWSSTTADSLEHDLGEFLQEEARVIPSGPELLQFMDAVDELQADVERIEARLRRLQSRMSSAPDAAASSP